MQNTPKCMHTCTCAPTRSAHPHAAHPRAHPHCALLQPPVLITERNLKLLSCAHIQKAPSPTSRALPRIWGHSCLPGLRWGEADHQAGPGLSEPHWGCAWGSEFQGGSWGLPSLTWGATSALLAFSGRTRVRPS